MNTLSTLEKYEYIFWKNSNWVREIDSWKPWKTFTITACTHWNEPAWIDTMYYLLEEFKISEKIISWKVQFLVVNIEAMQQNSRFVITDLNRVFVFW